jgi:hypothetical protein
MKKTIGILLTIIGAAGFIVLFIMAKNNDVNAVGMNMFYLLLLIVAAMVTLGGMHLVWRRRISS